LLRRLGFSLQANNSTTREGASHPDRNSLFEHINVHVAAFQAASEPAISVDTKKKELVGDFKNAGRELRGLSCACAGVKELDAAQCRSAQGGCRAARRQGPCGPSSAGRVRPGESHQDEPQRIAGARSGRSQPISRSRRGEVRRALLQPSSKCWRPINRARSCGSRTPRLNARSFPITQIALTNW
jgi:hypothetical protein